MIAEVIVAARAHAQGEKSRRKQLQSEDVTARRQRWTELQTSALDSENSDGIDAFHQMYELKERLGAGGFASVRAAVHKGTGEKVAVKVLTRHNMAVEEMKTEVEVSSHMCPERLSCSILAYHWLSSRSRLAA